MKIFYIILLIGVELTIKTQCATQYIVGGKPTKRANHKSLVLFQSQFGFCGGTLIAKKFVLTAKHCVTDFDNNVIDADQARLTLGEHDRTIDEGNEQERTGVAIYPHPVKHVDLAIIKLNKEAKITKFVKPVKLNCAAGMAVGTVARLYGWGQTVGDTGPSSSFLSSIPLYVDIKRVRNSRCENNGLKIRDTNMCVGKPKAVNRENACYGDSGSPLIEGDRLVGVIIEGPNNCLTSVPYSVFVKLYAVCDWIVEVVGGALKSQWTGWYNQMKPNGLGDFEELHSLIPHPCSSYFNQYVVAVKSNKVSCTNCSKKQKITVNRYQGLVCRNSEQDQNCVCCDYRVKYKCMI